MKQKKIINEHYSYNYKFYEIFSEEVLKAQNNEVIEEILFNIDFRESFKKDELYSALVSKIEEEGQYKTMEMKEILILAEKSLGDKLPSNFRQFSNRLISEIQIKNLLENEKISQAQEEYIKNPTITPEVFVDYYIKKENIQGIFELIEKLKQTDTFTSNLEGIIKRLLVYEKYQEAKKLIEKFKVPQISLISILFDLYEFYKKGLVDDVNKKIEEIIKVSKNLNIKITDEDLNIEIENIDKMKRIMNLNDINKLYESYKNEEKIEYKFYYLEKILDLEIKEKDLKDFKNFLDEYCGFLNRTNDVGCSVLIEHREDNYKTKVVELLCDKIYQKVKKIDIEKFVKKLEIESEKNIKFVLSKEDFVYPVAIVSFILGFSKEPAILEQINLRNIKDEYYLRKIETKLFKSKKEKKTNSR
ncbi:MAG: hypothetical protein QXV83_04325 [Candidatus Anstonellaceae archaeon]